MCRSTILDHSTTSCWVVNFTSRPLHPTGTSPKYPLDKRLGGHYGHYGARNLLPLPGVDPSHPVHNPWLYQVRCGQEICWQCHTFNHQTFQMYLAWNISVYFRSIIYRKFTISYIGIICILLYHCLYQWKQFSNPCIWLLIYFMYVRFGFLTLPCNMFQLFIAAVNCYINCYLYRLYSTILLVNVIDYNAVSERDILKQCRIMAHEVYLKPVLAYMNETCATPNKNKHQQLQTKTRAKSKQ
jgi:hypothetical protein